MEELLSFLTRLLLALSINKWTFTVVTNFFLNELLIVELLFVAILAVHYSVHGRELAIDGRLALIIIESAEAICLLVISLLRAHGLLEVVAGAELLAVTAIGVLKGNLLHLASVLGIKRAE